MNRYWNNLWPPLVAVLLFLAIWQGAVSLFHIEKWMLPAPVDIAQEAILRADGLGMHVWATTKLTLIGFAAGTAVGLLTAMLLHPIPFVKSGLYPLLILTQNIPTIALAPLLMIWFGFGLTPKLITIVLVCFFPVAVATMDGLMRTDAVMMNYMHMAGASRRRIFWKLEVPHALPSIFSGVKIAATYSVMGAVIAEWIGSDKGIGYYMMIQKSTYRTDRMFVAILIVVALSLLLFLLIVLLEKWLVRWRPQKR